MIRRIPMTKARINLGELVRRVHTNKEYILLEKGGIPVAGIIDVDEFEDYLELQDPALKEQIRQGYEEYKTGTLRSFDEFLADLEREQEKKLKKAS